MNKIRSITKVNLISWITTIVLISIVFSIFFIYQQYSKFRHDTNLLNKSYLNYKRDILRNDAEDVIKYINSELESNNSDAGSENQLPEILKNKLRELKLGTNYTLILDTESGNVLYSSRSGVPEGRPLKDPIILKILLIKAKQLSGGFVYSQKENEKLPVMYYVKPVKGFPWAVCSELREDAIIRAYAANRDRMTIDVVIETLFIGLLALIVFIIALRFSLAVSKSLQKEIYLIIEYLKNCFKGGELKEDEFKYEEFKFIGASSISMVARIRELLEKLKNIAVDSEMKYKSSSIMIDDISHEIRNKLNRIIGTSDVMFDELTADEKQIEHLKTISTSARSIAGFLDNIAAFSSPGLTEKSLNIEGFDILNLEYDLRSLVSRDLKRKGLKFHFHVDKDVPEFLSGDRLRIRQILMDLIENGIQFTDKGSISLYIRKASEEGEISNIDFDVIDTGYGISKEKIKIISEITNEDIALSPKFTGAALKLSVCKELLKAMHGTLSIESEKDKGTRITVSLPLKPAKQEEIKSEVGKLSEFGKGLQVLIVEDDMVNRDVERFYLKTMGFNVDTAVNGIDALEKLKVNKYSIIFMDYEMPELDGVETTKRIREIEKETGAHVSVVAITGYSKSEEIETLFDAGVDDYILKPFDIETVKRVVGKYIE